MRAASAGNVTEVLPSLPYFTRVGSRGTSAVRTTVGPSFHTRRNFDGSVVCTWSLASGLHGAPVPSVHGGLLSTPGTFAFASIREDCTHTAVMSRKEMVTMRRS